MTDTTSSDYPCNCRSCGTIISPSVTDMCEECEIAVERNYKKFYTPMTDTTNNFDLISRLQQIAATIEESGADIFDAPATAAHYLECAIKEIERLHRDYSCICSEMRRMMNERDEARRMWCEAVPVGNSLSVDDMDRRARAEAKRRGWDCFKESTNA